ncbi:hypothetical protein EDC01DRAFT_211354 [Geopyxis carbonaria]|nr:hypothetical protein EDC01DRAFT_211354 [Geopyxis carbonaria]
MRDWNAIAGFWQAMGAVVTFLAVLWAGEGTCMAGHSLAACASLCIAHGPSCVSAGLLLKTSLPHLHLFLQYTHSDGVHLKICY